MKRLTRRAGTWALQETPNPLVWKFQGDALLPRETKELLLQLPGVADASVATDGRWVAVTRESTAPLGLGIEVCRILEELPEGEHLEQCEPQKGEGDIEEVLLHRIRPSASRLELSCHVVPRFKRMGATWS